MFDDSPFVQGFALALGMFVCPGPKDLAILQQALRLRPTAELLTVGVGSDALLITLGILGVSAALQRAPQVQYVALWIGVGLMLWHGVQAIWRLAAGSVSEMVEDGVRNDRAALLLVSFLNPVAWMDTVLVIGTTGAVLPGRLQLSYGLGAVRLDRVVFATHFGVKALRAMAGECSRSASVGCACSDCHDRDGGLRRSEACVTANLVSIEMRRGHCEAE